MTDEELIKNLNKLGFNALDKPEHGSILCGDGADTTFYILDPREDPNFNGKLDKDKIISGMWGGF